jgi:hypothetical protein
MSGPLTGAPPPPGAQQQHAPPAGLVFSRLRLAAASNNFEQIMKIDYNRTQPAFNGTHNCAVEAGGFFLSAPSSCVGSAEHFRG